MMLDMAAAVMVTATMAQHLGLTEAIAKVALKISKCHMCCTFWASMLVLFSNGVSLAESALLSIFAAYMSNWLVMLLSVIEYIYHKLWQRLTRQ